MELLTRDDAARIKACPTTTDGCGWLCYDTNKNRSRRWCSMNGCGTDANERRCAAHAER